LLGIEGVGKPMYLLELPERVAGLRYNLCRLPVSNLLALRKQ
jgi:hypothetical protein